MRGESVGEISGLEGRSVGGDGLEEGRCTVQLLRGLKTYFSP